MLLRRRSRVRQILHQRRRNRVVFRRVRPRLLLASNSPRRRELLLEAGIDFEIFVPSVAESFGSEIIAKIDGSYTNVVGLPMEKTIAALTWRLCCPRFRQRDHREDRRLLYECRWTSDGENDRRAH